LSCKRGDHTAQDAVVAASAYDITTKVVDDDAVMVFTSPTTTDPTSGLPTPPPSEPRASPEEGRDLVAPRAPPKQICDLPDEILRKILGYVFVPPKVNDIAVRPWYKQGMLAGYIRTGNNIQTNIGDEVTQENIDIAQTMLVCKKFAELGQELFYGSAWFQFSDPDAFKWWLKQIGTTNLAQVRSLLVTIYPGLTVERETRSVFDLTSEEKWLQGFCDLRSRHKLNYLEVIVASDASFRQKSFMKQDEWEEISKYRCLLLDELLRYRNLKEAVIFDYTQFWGNRYECDQLSRLLGQEEDIEKTAVKTTTKRMSLAKLREEIRLNLEQEAMQTSSRLAQYDDIYPASRGLFRTGTRTDSYRTESRPTNPTSIFSSSGTKFKRNATYSKKNRRHAPQYDFLG
jgi:hypothetical protein